MSELDRAKAQFWGQRTKLGGFATAAWACCPTRCFNGPLWQRSRSIQPKSAQFGPKLVKTVADRANSVRAAISPFPNTILAALHIHVAASTAWLGGDFPLQPDSRTP